MCKDLTITECYVRHTTDFANRKKRHKSACTNPRDKHHNLLVYQYIRDNGGCGGWDMILIEQCKCENHLDALKKEREYVEQLKAILNVCIPSRYYKEWCEYNKEKMIV